MNFEFYYCTPNSNLSLLQHQALQVHWSLHDLIVFLRCIPLNLKMIDEAIRNNEGKYYLICDENNAPFFRVYFLSDHFEIVILQHIPNRITEELKPCCNYSQYSQLYKKSCSKNFMIHLYKVQFSVNYYTCDGKVSTSKYQISDASFGLLKKLSRAYPKNPEIRMEKMMALDSYSYQQCKNILSESTIKIKILSILNGLPGRIKIRVHELDVNELPFEECFSIHGFSWICPWSIEAIQKFQYIELDATFSILKPYICIIPQIIINGISLPLGFIGGPQENSSVYAAFYNDLLEQFDDKSILLKLPILSDGGLALEKFVKDLDLEQYLCIHHILKNIGANTFLGKVASHVLMSQTEEIFFENLSDAREIATSYMKARNGKINNKFLTSCFMKKVLDENNDETLVIDLESNQNLIHKTVLCFRNFIAAASNHAEGFHTHLKKIAKEKKGIEYNLNKLIQKINKRYIKYASGESINELCTRIKKELLDQRNKYSIEPTDKCNCTSNYHKKQILGIDDLPCMHTIQDESEITVKVPNLDEKKFLQVTNLQVVPSELEGKTCYDKTDSDTIEQDIKNYAKEIDESINANYKLMIQHHCDNELSCETKEVLTKIINEAFDFGLGIHKLNDFVKFLMSELLIVLISNDGNDSTFILQKNELIGRYFAHNE